MKKNLFILLIAMMGTIYLAQAQIEKKQDSLVKTTKYSEEIFSKHFPLAFTFQYQHLDWISNNENATHYKELEIWAPALGVEYNFYQLGKFNLKAGFFVRYFRRKQEFNLDASDIPYNSNLSYETSDGPYWTYHLPVTVEFINKITDKFYGALHLGYELQYYGYTSGKETYPTSYVAEQGQESYPTLSITEEERQKSLTGGINLGLGSYIEIGSTLAKVSFSYHHHFSDIIYKRVQTINLLESPSNVSNYKLSGDYISFGITFFPWRKNKNF